MELKFRTPIKEMTSPQKEWFATAMVAVVLADGTVSQGEVTSLLNSISFVQDPTAVDRLKKHIQFQAAPPIPSFVGWENDVKKRAAIMLDLIHVAIADNDFSEQEKDKFYEIGKLLNFERGKIDDLFVAADKFMQNLD